MSDEVAKAFKSKDSPTQLEAGRSFSLTITLQPNGQLELSGPLQNHVLSFGLLGAAAAKLTELYTIETLQAQSAKVAASRGGMAGLVKRMNGG